MSHAGAAHPGVSKEYALQTCRDFIAGWAGLAIEDFVLTPITLVFFASARCLAHRASVCIRLQKKKKKKKKSNDHVSMCHWERAALAYGVPRPHLQDCLLPEREKKKEGEKQQEGLEPKNLAVLSSPPSSILPLPPNPLSCLLLQRKLRVS